MKNNIIDLLANNIEGLSRDELEQFVEIPPKTELGDFAFPCFRLAKIYRKAPQMIAQELKEKNMLSLYEKIEFPLINVLYKMEKDGLIVFEREEEKRKLYRITELGKEILHLEIKRIERLYKNSKGEEINE